MKAALFLALAMLAGCATRTALEGTVVAPDRSAQVVPGQSTKAQLLATLGKTDAAVSFDSGYQAWMYQVPADGGRYSEFVVLIDPQGMVRKTRRRPPELPPRP
ncbi:hypothetical protein [Massilia terrae]|uniref:Outer membrane protein assembly factor BamE n=1 Tax=Massilia terrae TaxID=1811224 RepID=A0ABT2D463_9BURK|nr:hypothetical protein [Massilia terrae]MCS0661007.1 hypothetical protein [Massilia terrae]